MSPGVRWGIRAACAATAWGGLRPGEPALVAQVQEAIDVGVDLTGPLGADLAAFQRDVAPWQPGYGQARRQLQEISRLRREALDEDPSGPHEASSGSGRGPSVGAR